ncbi:MAG: flavohemoprotein [Chloroflexi bacterium]|nr:flavohemoprotein [Chloroflexota bacterium]
MVILLDLEKALFDDAKDAPQYKEPDAPKNETPDDAEDKTPGDAPGLNVELLEKSFKKIATRGEEFAAAFYDKLFSMYPESKAFFVDTDMKEQQKKLFSSLVLIVNNLRKPDVLGPVLKQLGERHRELHVKDEHYPMVGDALLETLSDFLGSKWTPKLKKAWSDAYAAIVDGMTKG